MVCANQARHSQDCGRYPGEQSFEIPAFGSVVEAPWGWVEERWRVDVAFLDEEVVDDDDLMAVDGQYEMCDEWRVDLLRRWER